MKGQTLFWTPPPPPPASIHVPLLGGGRVHTHRTGRGEEEETPGTRTFYRPGQPKDLYRSKCSTPTSSASSAPISLVTCSKVLEVGVPSFGAQEQRGRGAERESSQEPRIGISLWVGYRNCKPAQRTSRNGIGARNDTIHDGYFPYQ